MSKILISCVTAVLLATVTATVPASATPGAVNAKGCHGHPHHCHPASELSHFRNGRRYVQFGNG